MFKVVQKFGGTSVSNIERIQKTAQIVLDEYNKGSAVVVVVSAMSGVTDQLIHYVKSIYDTLTNEELAEYDAVIASGEQITAGLTALALRALGIKSRSFLGWQLPIVTDNAHAHGRISSIGTTELITSLKMREIPVIAGFQGIHDERIVTLGRGGSDTTATAIAAAICADRCDIFTDVEGVFSADPRVVQEATKITNISYTNMLAMATAGAKILHPRAVDIALRNNLETRILSSFHKVDGTTIAEEASTIERGSILAVISNSKIAIIRASFSNTKQDMHVIFSKLTATAINIETSAELRPGTAIYDLEILLKKSELSIALSILQHYYIAPPQVLHDIAKITVISNGLTEKTLLLQKIFKTLHVQDINIMKIYAVDNVAVIVDIKDVDKATIALHNSLNID